VNDRLGLCNRVDTLIEWSRVHDVQQQARTLQVAQELVTKPRPSAAPSIRPGKSANDKTLLWADANHAQIGMQCCERVVRDARTCIGNCSDESGLSGIGHAKQTNISEHLAAQA